MLIVPRYLQEIAKPRDFGTIMKKIEGKEGRKYQTMQQLGEDIELVFNKYVSLVSFRFLCCTALTRIVVVNSMVLAKSVHWQTRLKRFIDVNGLKLLIRE